jgi:hypothetical protein
MLEQRHQRLEVLATSYQRLVHEQLGGPIGEGDRRGHR